jgi:hypothetical protein
VPSDQRAGWERSRLGDGSFALWRIAADGSLAIFGHPDLSGSDQSSEQAPAESAPIGPDCPDQPGQ